MAFVPTKWCVPQTLTTEERKHDLAELISSKKIKLEPSVKYKKVSLPSNSPSKAASTKRPTPYINISLRFSKP